MSVLKVSSLCKTYPAFTLKDVSFNLERGSIMGFIGRNGAGKTTTLKSILNLVHPDSGSIEFFGLPLKNNEDVIKQKIGYVVSATGYYKKKKIRDITAVTKSFYPEWDDEAWKHYLEVFSLDENKAPEQLSEGMKVKYSISLALSHKAELLILDEPTSGLDPISRAELLDIFSQLRDKGVSILFSSHITTDLDKCADSITYIKNGSILFSGKIEEIGMSLDDYMLKNEKKEINV
jgi:ABC-2 type transport system ATP-binding protein